MTITYYVVLPPSGGAQLFEKKRIADSYAKTIKGIVYPSKIYTDQKLNISNSKEESF